MDEFELRVTALERDEPAPEDAPAGGDSPPRTPAAVRRRLLGLSALGALALALLVVVGGMPGMREELGTLFAGATPGPLPYGADTLYLVNVVPWGRLTIDGSSHFAQPLTHASPTIVLPRGHHQLRYIAPPFPSRACVVSVPAARGDTCRRRPRLPDDTAAIQSPAMRALDLGDTLGALASTQYDELLAAVTNALEAASPAGTVRPGEHYGTAGGAVAVANAPLPVTLVYQLDPAPATINGSGGARQVCAPLCASALTYPGAPNRDRWPVTAHVMAVWRVGASGPLIPAPLGDDSGERPLLRGVLVSWDGNWHVEVEREPIEHPPADNQIDNQTCRFADGAQGVFFSSRPAAPSPTGSVTSFIELAAESPLDGCLVVTQVQPRGGRQTTRFVLYRYGALLAANGETVRAYPGMTQATPGEIALAHQITRVYGYEM